MSMWLLPYKPSHEHPQTEKEIGTQNHIFWMTSFLNPRELVERKKLILKKEKLLKIESWSWLSTVRIFFLSSSKNNLFISYTNALSIRLLY